MIVASEPASSAEKSPDRKRAPESRPANRKAASTMPTGWLRPEQRDGDAGEAERRDGQVDVRDPVLDAEHLARAGQAGEGAADAERQHHRPPHRDAAVAGRLGVEADGPDLVAERRPRDHRPVHGRRRQRDEDADVDALDLAPDGGEDGAPAQRLGVGLAARLVLERPAQADQPPPDVDGDEVEHDRRDHLVRPAVGLQHAGDAAVEEAAERTGGDAEHPAERAADPQRGHERRHHAGGQLALAADVEEAGAEGERDGEAGQDERRRLHDRRDQVDLGELPVDAERVARDELERPVEAGADPQALVDRERVAARRRARRARRSGTRSRPSRAGTRCRTRTRLTATASPRRRPRSATAPGRPSWPDRAPARRPPPRGAPARRGPRT